MFADIFCANWWIFKNDKCLKANKIKLKKTKNSKPQSDAEFKEFEPRLEFETQLKYSWFPLKLYLMFQDLSRHSIESGLWRI